VKKICNLKEIVQNKYFDIFIISLVLIYTF